MDIEIHVDNVANVSSEELDAYLTRAKKLIEDGELPWDVSRMEILPTDDPEEVEIKYYRIGTHFNRIRRITGYLVSDLLRWNDAKRAEEHDRVKHLSHV